MAKKNPTTKPTKHVTVYARNNREIARALGLKTKPKQLVEIGEWIQREDFPAKSSKGYVIADLKVFFNRITPELALKKFRAQLADPESKLSPSEFNKLVELSGGAVNSTIAANGTNRTDGTYGETDGRGGRDANPPEIVQGLTKLATWITAVFKIPCTKQVIKKWQHEIPPFPAAVSADYRYRWSEVKDWVEKHKASPMSGNSRYATLLVKLEPERLSAELEEIEHQRMLREVEKGAYLKKSDVARACQGIGKTINGVINNRLELRMRASAILKLQERPANPPFTPEQVEHVALVFTELGRETSSVLKAELRAAMMQLPADETAENSHEAAKDTKGEI